MHLVSYLNNENELEVFKKTQIKDLIFSPLELSRLGKLSKRQINELSYKAKNMGFRPILLWDLLMTETVFKESIHHLQSLCLENFYAVRLQDPGAFYFILRKFSQMKIQLILERGNHNLDAISFWCEAGGKNLERLILPLEFDRGMLIRILKAIKVKVEILGWGKILLYQSPRKLLSNDFKRETDEFIHVEGRSDEIPLKGFSFVENTHGTFMFYPKDYFLLEYIDDLKKIGVDFLRLDISLKDSCVYRLVSQLLDGFNEDIVSLIKRNHSRGVIRGFYSVNRSDSLFSKLKNPYIRPDSDFLGEVVEVKKDQYVAIVLKNKQYFLKKGDNLLFKTPDGKEKRVVVNTLKNTSGEKVIRALPDDLVMMPPMRGISVKTAVYFNR